MRTISIPRCTILMPAYNAERHIREAVDSILAQTMQDFIFLIIDDGSSDQTAAIIESYQDARIRLVCREHEGLTAQLNYGLSIIETPFVARMDADDRAHPERLARQITFLDQHPEVGVLGCWYHELDESSVVGRLHPLPVDHTAISEALSVFCVIVHPGVMYRRTLVLEQGGYDPRYPFAEDYALWQCLAHHTRFHNLPLPLIEHRTTSCSISSVRAREQRAHHVAIARDALARQVKAGTMGIRAALYKESQVLYYHDSPRAAIMSFHHAIGEGVRVTDCLRYLIVLYLFGPILPWLRRKGIASAITAPLQRFRWSKRMLAP